MKNLVSIIIPIYKDATKIGKTVDILADFFNNEQIPGEIIVINDGGTDNGVAIVKEKMQRYPLLRLIDRNVNRGKGYTIKEGLNAATGMYIFFTDADLPYLTQPIKEMIELLDNKTADFVLASRDISTAVDYEKPSWPRQITHGIYSLLVRILIPIKFTDTLAGLKGTTRDAMQLIVPKMTIERFSFDVEMLLIAQKAGLKIKEVAVSLKNVGESNLKISKDAPQMTKDVLKIWWQNKKGNYN